MTIRLINITGPDIDPVFVPINLTVTGENSSPVLPFIDISSSDDGIVELPASVDTLFLAVASRYTHIMAPDGGVIPIIAQDDFSSEQILHVRNVLNFFLKNIPDSQWGDDKASVANAISQSNAILFLLNDEAEYNNQDLLNLMALVLVVWIC